MKNMEKNFMKGTENIQKNLLMLKKLMKQLDQQIFLIIQKK